MAKASAGKTRQAEKAQAVTHPILTLTGLEDASLWEELIQEASALAAYVQMLKRLPPNASLRLELEDELISALMHLETHAHVLRKAVDEQLEQGATFEEVDEILRELG